MAVMYKVGYIFPPSLPPRLTTWWDSHPITPGTKFSSIWELTLVGVVITICWIYSYQAGFSLYQPNISYGSGEGWRAVYGLTYLLDLVLLLDIVVSMKTAVRTPTGEALAECAGLYICTRTCLCTCILLQTHNCGAKVILIGFDIYGTCISSKGYQVLPWHCYYQLNTLFPSSLPLPPLSPLQTLLFILCSLSLTLSSPSYTPFLPAFLSLPPSPPSLPPSSLPPSLPPSLPLKES